MGIDIGKYSFHVVGLDQRGAIVLRAGWLRGQVEPRLANMPPCRIGMEACVGVHHLSRKLQSHGHDARLMPAKYVRAYLKGQKNDFRDAEAIAEAVQRPTMRFVATKTTDQLDLQRRCTGCVNGWSVSAPASSTRFCAFMLERGIAVRQGLRFLRTALPNILATRSDVLSPRMMHLIEELAGNWHWLDERIEGVSTDIKALADQDPACERLMTVPGIGPIISSATVAAIGNGAAFSKGRDFGAWLGLVPRQISTGDRTILGKISKQGNRYLRVLFVQAAREFVPGEADDVGAPLARSPGSKPPRSGCTTTCWQSRSPTSLLASPGRFSTRSATSNAPGPMGWRPDLFERGTVLGSVKAWPGSAEPKASQARRPPLTAPARGAGCKQQTGRRNGHMTRTKELHR